MPTAAKSVIGFYGKSMGDPHTACSYSPLSLNHSVGFGFSSDGVPTFENRCLVGILIVLPESPYIVVLFEPRHIEPLFEEVLERRQTGDTYSGTGR